MIRTSGVIAASAVLGLLFGCDQEPEEVFSVMYEKEAGTVMSVHQPLHFARLREASPSTNFSGQPLYLGASADGIEIALVQYNAEQFQRANVEKAVLHFSAGQTCHSSYVATFPKCGIDLVVEAHEVALPWEQRAVTWASFYEPAEPYKPATLGTALLNSPKGEHRQYVIDVTAAIKGWISGQTNYGIALIADEKGQRKGRFQQVDTVLNYAPELVVYEK